jgi:hypothetical protein
MEWVVGSLTAITGLLFWFLLRAERAGAAASAEAKQEVEHAERMDEKAKADTEKDTLANIIQQDAVVAGGDADGLRRTRLSEALRHERDS